MRSQRNNRQAIIDAMPGTQLEIASKLSIGRSTVCRWLVDIVECGDAHVYKESFCEHGGPKQLHYAVGPAVKRLKSIKAVDDKSRSARYRKRMRAAGDWEDVKAKQRETYHLTKPVKRDKLTSFFFGKVKND